LGGTPGATGPGGQGVYSDITGSSVQRAAGGGSGGSTGGAGGSGGGGTGASVNSLTNGTNGSTPGSGGGGGANDPRLAGNGADGIIVLRYLDSLTANFSGGLTTSTSTAGGYKTSTITAGTGTVTFV
jgi:hypothetical protein